MKPSDLAWSLLQKSLGAFAGEGVNHEGQRFKGTLRLREAVPGKALALESKAEGMDGEVYHHELSWVGPDLAGALTLYVASSNHPAIAPHLFHRLEEQEGARVAVFRCGDFETHQGFREEVAFSFFPDGSVSHHYSWGLPGGKFEPRSGSRMQRA
jgi:hypothetical protein